jgi:hypothetical protein
MFLVNEKAESKTEKPDDADCGCGCSGNCGSGRKKKILLIGGGLLLLAGLWYFTRKPAS